VLPAWIERKIENGILGFKIDTRYDKDIWLSFIVSYVGIIVTILALVITIKYNNKVIRNSFEIQRIKQQCDNEKTIAEQILKLITLDKYEIAEKRGRDMDYIGRLKFDITQIKSIMQGKKECEFYKEIRMLIDDYDRVLHNFKPFSDNGPCFTEIEQKVINKIDELIESHNKELFSLLNKYCSEIEGDMKKQIEKIVK
jgi:hypothetical protein